MPRINDDDRKKLHEALKPVLRDGLPCVVTVTVLTAPDPPDNMSHYTLVNAMDARELEAVFDHLRGVARGLVKKITTERSGAGPADGGPINREWT